MLDLSKHVDQRVRVKFTGGREGAYSTPSFFLSCATPSASANQLVSAGTGTNVSKMLGNAIVGVVGRSVRGVPRCSCVACKLAQRHVSTLREGQVLSKAASLLSLQMSCLFQQIVLISRLCLSTTACYEHPHAMILQLLLLLFPLAVEGRLKGFDTLVNLMPSQGHTSVTAVPRHTIRPN